MAARPRKALKGWCGALKGHCSGIFLEPQGIRNGERQSRGEIYRLWVHFSVCRATTFRFLKTAGRSPSQAACQEHAGRAKRISRVARHELAGRNKGILLFHSLKDGLYPPKNLPGETSFTANYSSHQLLLTAQWLSDQTCTWHLSGLWVRPAIYLCP